MTSIVATKVPERPTETHAPVPSSAGDSPSPLQPRHPRRTPQSQNRKQQQERRQQWKKDQQTEIVEKMVNLYEASETEDEAEDEPDQPPQSAQPEGRVLTFAEEEEGSEDEPQPARQPAPQQQPQPDDSSDGESSDADGESSDAEDDPPAQRPAQQPTDEAGPASPPDTAPEDQPGDQPDEEEEDDGGGEEEDDSGGEEEDDEEEDEEKEEGGGAGEDVIIQGPAALIGAEARDPEFPSLDPRLFKKSPQEVPPEWVSFSLTRCLAQFHPADGVLVSGTSACNSTVSPSVIPGMWLARLPCIISLALRTVDRHFFHHGITGGDTPSLDTLMEIQSSTLP